MKRYRILLQDGHEERLMRIGYDTLKGAIRAKRRVPTLWRPAILCHVPLGPNDQILKEDQ